MIKEFFLCFFYLFIFIIGETIKFTSAKDVTSPKTRTVKGWDAPFQNGRDLKLPHRGDR